MDGRICIKPDINEWANFQVNREDISLYDTVEVLRRLPTYLSLAEAGMFSFPNPILDSLEIIPRQFLAEGEISKICIVWNSETHQIRIAINGLNLWEACLVLHNACLYLTGEYLSYSGEKLNG